MEHAGAAMQVSQNAACEYGKTVRVRGVPLNWTDDQLLSFLRKQEYLTCILVELSALEIHGRSLTATAIFQDVPDSLQVIRPGHAFSLPLPILCKGTRPQYLTLDVDFSGMTVLFTPPEEDHKAE